MDVRRSGTASPCSWLTMATATNSPTARRSAELWEGVAGENTLNRRGSGCELMALSTAILSGRGVSSARGVASRLSKPNAAICAQ